MSFGTVSASLKSMAVSQITHAQHQFGAAKSTTSLESRRHWTMFACRFPEDLEALLNFEDKTDYIMGKT